MKSFGVVARPKAPAGYIGVWINIYKVLYHKGMRIHSGGSYPTRRQADNVANSKRKDCVYVHVKVN